MKKTQILNGCETFAFKYIFNRATHVADVMAILVLLSNPMPETS